MVKKNESLIIDISTNGFLKYLETLPEESQEKAKNRYASMAVRLWYDAEGADGYRKKIEREKIISLIQNFFIEDSLFSPKFYSIEKRKSILKDLIDSESSSVTMEDVCNYLKTLPESIRDAFFHDACFIIATDKQIATKEVDYLKNLGKLLNIPEEEIKKEFSFFWIPQS
jgi:uncharacterized tellurite resistance protein B-like protein